MFGYKCVLVATDLTPHGTRTLELALDLLKETKGNAHVVHVLESSPLSYAGDFSLPMDMSVGEKVEHQAGLLLQQISEKYELPLKNIHLLNGAVKHAVAKVAQEIKADLIVIGSHGQGAAMEALLGSRANAILHHAPCDVWVMKTKKD